MDVFSCALVMRVVCCLCRVYAMGSGVRACVFSSHWFCRQGRLDRKTTKKSEHSGDREHVGGAGSGTHGNLWGGE